MANNDNKGKAPKRLPTLTTPEGRFRWPKLNEVDYGTKEYPNPDGSYSVQLIVDADSEEAKALINTLNPLYIESEAAAQEEFNALAVGTRKKLGNYKMNPLFDTLYDPETEEPTGEIAFKFAMKASGVYKSGAKKDQKWTRKPDLFDAKGKTLHRPPTIWGGTTGRVGFAASPYFIPGTGAAGLKLELRGVQIIDLVSSGGRTAEDMGFGAVEGGYEHHEHASEDGETNHNHGGNTPVDIGDEVPF